MRLYYTGAPADQASQGTPTVSLGGYVSSTPVPNGVEGSLFSNPSQAEIASGGTRSLLLALRNLTAETVSGLSVYAKVESEALFTIELGAIVPGSDQCGDILFETITTPKSLPIGISFVAATEAIPLSIGSLVPNGVVGIWVKQTILKTANASFSTCDKLIEAFNDPESEAALKDFPFDICFSYD